MNDSEPSIVELMTQLSGQTGQLVRDELQLAKAELMGKARQGAAGAVYLGVAGFLAVFGFGGLVTTAILALGLVVPAWAAALIVTLVLLAAATIAALVGRTKLKELSPVPDRAVASVEQDIKEIKEGTQR